MPSRLRLAAHAFAGLCSAALGACGVAALTPDDLEAGAGKGSTREQSPALELSAAEVVLKLRGNETELRRCFFANPSARGTLQLSWRVSSESRVERLKRERSTLTEPRIEACLAEKLSEVRFEPRAEPVRAHWTFVFQLVEPLKTKRSSRRTTKQDRDRVRDNEQGVELEASSPGFLAPEVVDNVVELGFPLFARCYRDGVQRNSKLDGAVRLRFVVARSGQVTAVRDGGSDLTDRQVVDCVAEGFYGLRFPEPTRGEAHLVYRIHFESG